MLAFAVGTPSARGDCRSPFVGAHIAGVFREEPMMPVEVLDTILKLAIACLVQFLHNFSARGFGPAIVRIDIVNEDGQTLSSAAELLRARAIAPGMSKHDDRFAEAHLRADDGVAIAVMLGEAEGLGQPSNRLANVLIDEVGQHGVGRDRAIVHTLLTVLLLSAYYCLA
jgi:hypothetical protein